MYLDILHLYFTSFFLISPCDFLFFEVLRSSSKVGIASRTADFRLSAEPIDLSSWRRRRDAEEKPIF